MWARCQFDHPEVTITFDTDSKAAAAERKATFLAAAKDRASCWARPIFFISGVLHLRAAGQGFSAIPLNSTQIR